MTENMAERGEGLAGLRDTIDTLKNLSDTRGLSGAELLALQEAIATLAAAPAGTAPPDMADSFQAVLVAYGVYDSFNATTMERMVNDLLALATPSPQAPGCKCEDIIVEAGDCYMPDKDTTKCPIHGVVSADEVAGIRQGLADVAAGRTKPIEQIRAEMRERKLLENADILAIFQKYIPQLCRKIGLQTISQIVGALNDLLVPPAATQEQPAGSGASDGPLTVSESLPGHAMTHQGHWVRGTQPGSPRKVGEDAEQTHFCQNTKQIELTPISACSCGELVGSGALREALIKLSNEASGMLGLSGVREAIGNTNMACLQLRVDEARALLSLSSPIEPPPTSPTEYHRAWAHKILQAIEEIDENPAYRKLGVWATKRDLLAAELAAVAVRPTPQASSEIRERKNGESNLPWLQRVKLDGYIACGQHGDRYGENAQVWDLTCERCSQRFDAIVHVLEALAPSRQGAGGK